MKKNNIRIAVLALQGAFAEHRHMLEELGVETIELRQRKDLEQEFDGLILPGGESTVQGKLLEELDMYEPLARKIAEGLPVLATCAGLILLAETIENNRKSYFASMPVTVRRNAYGRQLGSFSMCGEVQGIQEDKFPMEFIRAPYITRVGNGVNVLAEDKEHHVVGVRYQKQFAFAFHPELTEDVRIHQIFLDTVTSEKL